MSLPVAAIDRPLALRTRPDLIAAPVELAGAATWVVKDPRSMEHFQFTVEEYVLVDRLRRPASIAELEREFAHRFPPQTISAEAVWEFVRRLHEAGLTVADTTGQGGELLIRERRDTARRWATAWMQVLAIRFRGIDPDALLTRLYDQCRWIFSPVAFLAALAVVLYAGSLIVGQFAEFQSRLPGLEALSDLRNVPWLLASIGLVKVLHELGHALACKHFGGEVRELGFMLLAFSPCLYCDVSDAWRFPSKWRRIAVSAAGMIVELLLAAVATIVWWHAEPGVIQLVAMNIMIVASVGTLLVNGNPLLRYDGYYILSDLAEQPNLWQRSRDVLRRFSARWVLGDDPPNDPLLPARGRVWLAAYALASKVYVTLVCVAVIWGLVLVLHPLHLHSLAYGLGLVMLGGEIYPPVKSAGQFLRNPIRRAELRGGRVAAISAAALAVAVVIMAWPVNYYVRAPLVLMPVDAARVYSSIDGTLVSARTPGERVSAGETVAVLQNSAVEIELAQLEGERREQALRVEHLDRLRGIDPEANEKLPAARAALASFDDRLQQRRRDAERLKLTAPVDGVILAAPRIPANDKLNGQLPTWSGTMLDAANRGALVEPITLVCLVGDPARQSAILVVEDSDATKLHAGQPVRIRLDQLPGQILSGEVIEVSRRDADDGQSEEASGDQLEHLFAGLTTPGDLRAHYQVKVHFAAPPQPLVIGGRGEAKIAAEKITLARRLLRFLGHTFRLPM